MDDLWKVIAEIASTMSSDRIASIADAISELPSAAAFEKAKGAFGPNADRKRLDRLNSSWMSSGAKPSEIAAALRAAAQAVSLMEGKGSVELVWTGPKTGLIPTRQTEQVLIEVIDSARLDLFLVTYVFYRASGITRALNAALKRGAAVRILLESSIEQGGAIKGDSIGGMREAVPGATIYIWDPAARRPSGTAAGAAVHAKCAVADEKLAFITSANLTSAAMERNMELGLLIRQGDVPRRLREHLGALISTKVIAESK